MTDADKAMNPQHFGNYPADIRITIQINPDIPDSNPGSRFVEVRRLGECLRSLSTVYLFLF